MIEKASPPDPNAEGRALMTGVLPLVSMVKAIGAVARHLAEAAWHVLSRKEP